MRHKFTVATIATLVLAACMVAFVPTVRGQVGEAIAKWFRIEFPGGKVAVEMSGPAEFTPLHPTYLPAGLQSSGISTKVSGESESVELVCHNEEQFVAVTQTKAPADRALPAGRKVTVKGQKGVLIAGLEGTFEGGPRIPKDALVQKEERPPTEPIRIRGERISIPYDDGKRLVWYVSDVKVEMLSNLSEEEMLKVAESLVPAEAEEGEAPFHPPDLPIEEKVEGGLIREGPIESNP
ncbi:MAG: hypothetical protein U9Q78_04945 [Chloroflexota bacterium]|nr:hypothetical protein [Chloroflexota bacterium]